MTCKTTGWCAVGFTTTASGRNMQNYDIAVGGVVSNTPYLDVSMERVFVVLYFIFFRWWIKVKVVSSE